jgi:hypothetical protein
MSGQSPAVVLYSSDGTELTVVSGSAIPSSTRAILVSGQTPAGNASYVPSSSDGAFGITQMANHQVAQNAATVSASGNFTTTLMYAGAQEMVLVVDVGTVTGAGNITYTIQEIDTVGNVYGNSASTSAISTGNAPGVFTAVLNVTTAMNFKISWTVAGGAFSATITSYVVSKSTPSTQTINGTVTATNNSVGSDASAALAFDTQVGGKTTTSAPTYVTGNLDVLSLTTLGGLRIDGVYASGTASGTAADIMVSGGYATTSAPTYTTGQLNSLSLDLAGNLRTVNTSIGATGAAAPANATFMGALVTTAAESGLTNNDMYSLNMTTTGQLRIDGVYPTATAIGTAVDMGLSGGSVTTAAPAYSNSTVNALSLNTAGGLRIDGVSATAATTGGTAMLSGGAVTTAAPAYTTGQMDPLSLTTLGGLRVDGVYVAGTANATAADVGVVGGYVTTAAPTYTTGQLNPLSLDTSGNLRVSAITNKATTSAVTSVAGATSSTAILAANTSRVFASIYNGTNKNMYVLCNSGSATTSNYSILLITGSYWEVPSDYQGAINAIWSSGVSGNALVTEYTP